MNRLNAGDWIAIILVIVGGLNWGLVGFADYNLVDALFGAGTTLSAVVYDLVGLAAIYMIFTAIKVSKPAM